MDGEGKPVKGTIEAVNSDQAVNSLRKKGLFPTGIKVASGKKQASTGADPMAVTTTKRRKGGFRRVPQKLLTVFTRQLSTLIDAGLPIVRSLDILGGQLKKGQLKYAIEDIHDDVQAGATLSESMAKHPKCFDRLYTNMVKAGETGGVLDQILQRLADFMEKAEKLKKRVIAAMIYPAAVVTIAVLILAGIMIFVIPKFKEIFTDMQIELPMATKLLLGIADWVVNYWMLLVLLPIVIGIVVKLVRASKGGRYAVDRALLMMPVLGMILRKSSISRFARTLGTLIRSGVPILDAINIVRETTGNVVIATAISDVHDSIREGESISAPLKQSGQFDDIVVNMIDVGEETGELDKMLLKIADTFDDDVDAAVGGMMSLLEPLLIVGMGLTVGFIVVALFMPLLTIMESI